MKKYHISIIGSCVSRDVFNSKFISDYSKYFVVDSYFARTTMPSIVGNPIPYNINILEKDFDYVYFEYHYTECAKQMLATLRNNQSDFLLLDFYGDAYNGTYQYGNTYIKGSLGDLKKSCAIDTSKLGKRYNFENFPEEYFDIWCKSFDSFMNYANENFPETKIFVNGILGNNKITETINGKVIDVQQPKIDLKKLNAFWEKLNRYSEERHSLPVLRYEEEYTLDPNYLYGLKKQFVHFHQNYYKDAFNKILTFCGKNGTKNHVTPNFNLIRNFDFSLGEKYWDFADAKWKLCEVGDKKMIAPKENVNAQWNACWCDPIEINADGNTEYILSFDGIYCGKKILRALPAIGIRTFKRAMDKTYSQCISAEIVKIPSDVINKNKEFHYTYIFKPKGKYIRIAPHVKGNMINIMFTNIQLQKIL